MIASCYKPERPVDEIETADLVVHARSGNNEAWAALVERFLPLIRMVARGYRLGDSDSDDISQTVWTVLLEHIGRIREPRALPAWLITTTRRECLRLLRQQRRAVLVDPLAYLDDYEVETENGVDADLLRWEQARVLHESVAELPPLQRDLLRLLTDEPTLSYREISAVLTMPVGSIGPTRARGLARLRATPAVRDYLFPAREEDRPA